MTESHPGSAVEAADRQGLWRSWYDTGRFPLVAFAGVATAVWVIVWWSARNLLRVEPFLRPVPSGGGEWIEGWLRWDAVWYRSIADAGYSYRPGSMSSVAFFPGYPLVVRFVSALTGDTSIAGVAVTVVAGSAAAWLLWRWTGTSAAAVVGSLGERRCAVAALLAWPWAYYLYGAVYADALFLALALGAFVLVEQDRIALAAFVATVAGATRPVGIAVAIALALRVVERRGGWRAVRLPTAGALALGLSGVVAYGGYLWLTFGDPVAFSTVQAAPGWDQPAGLHTWLKASLFEELRAPTGRAPVRILVVQAILTLTVVSLIPMVWRRFGRAYGVYTAMVVVIPAVGSKDFQGMGRYVLAAFPVFALVGGWLAGVRPVVRQAVLGTSLALMVSFAALFGTGHYLS